MSKKIFALVLAAAMVCAFALTTSAAVVPSATVDTTPDVSDSVTSDSGWSMPVGDVAVGSLQNPESLSDEAYRELRDATNQITNAESVGDFLADAGLTNAVSAALAGTSTSISDLSVQSVFDVSVTGDVAARLAAEGSVDITFSVPGVRAGNTVVVLHYNGTTWDVRPSTASNGAVTATFTSLSPVAILVDTSASGNLVTSPQTGDMHLEGMLVGGSLLCAAALVYCLKRRQEA